MEIKMQEAHAHQLSPAFPACSLSTQSVILTHGPSTELENEFFTSQVFVSTYATLR